MGLLAKRLLLAVYLLSASGFAAPTVSKEDGIDLFVDENTAQMAGTMNRRDFGGIVASMLSDPSNSTSQQAQPTSPPMPPGPSSSKTSSASKASSLPPSSKNSSTVKASSSPPSSRGSSTPKPTASAASKNPKPSSTAPKPTTTSKKPALTMTAILGTATPFKQAGDMSAQTFHDQVYQQLDSGCAHDPGQDWASASLCPNQITIPNVNVLENALTTGTITILIDHMNYRDEQIRGALINMIAGMAQSTINSESSKPVKYITEGLSRRDVNGTTWIEELSQADSDELTKRDPLDIPTTVELHKTIVQGTIPNSLEADIYDTESDVLVGSVTLLPSWNANQQNLFSQMMCNLAMDFIQSTVLDVVSTALGVAGTLSGTDLNPCDGFSS